MSVRLFRLSLRSQEAATVQSNEGCGVPERAYVNTGQLACG
jgi:hypothetical protein